MAGIEGLLAGHTLGGRYRIEEVIGRGGMAAVYRAHDERLGRTVAVKVIMVAVRGATGEGRLRARFEREARAAARLQHPHVVTVFDFGTDPELHLDYLVMELLRGEDLASRVDRAGPPPLPVALRILREAAEGIGAGHRAGLIHRDVKPGNLFLVEEQDGETRVRVLDFGIARLLTGDDGPALTRGSAPLSPAYAAPEQLAGGVELTPAADVYSLGVIAHELLAGGRLFGGATAGHVRSAVPRLDGAPPAVRAVVERALAPEPADRYPDGEALARALDDAAAAAEPTPAPGATPPVYQARGRTRLPRGPVHPVPAERRGGRRGAVIAGVVLLAAAAGGALWLAARSPDDAAPAATLAPRSDAPPTSVTMGRDTVLVWIDEPDAAAAPAPAGNPPGGGAETAPSLEGSAASLNARGLERFGAGDHAAAVDLFRAAVARAPDDTSIRNNLGWALFRAGQVGDAGRELAAVARSDPSRDIVHANLGEVHLAQGDTASAITAYRRFLELNADARRERIASEKLRRIGGE